MADYEGIGNGLLLGSLFTKGPVSIILLLAATLCSAKACDDIVACSKKNCATGSPMIVKGECICTERPR